MARICLYFQAHQPSRLKEYTFYRIGRDHNYGATQQNYAILQRVSEVCYLPANEMIMRMIDRSQGEFRCAFSITGTLMDQLETFRPDVLESFHALAHNTAIEFCAETYYHSLAWLYSRAEFERQVRRHHARIAELAGRPPVTLRNTELIYENSLAVWAAEAGYTTVLAEGVKANLEGRQETQVYLSPGGEGAARLMLRHFTLSDDIAFRFTNTNWEHYPLTPDKFVGWLAELADAGAETINLFMDYETLGEHRRRDSGIFEFFEQLPRAARKVGLSFGLPAQIAGHAGAPPRQVDIHGRPIMERVSSGEWEGNSTPTLPVYDAPEPTSWADEARDLSAWRHDPMQQDALAHVYELEPAVRAANDTRIWEVWGRLQTSDHFYYMSTRYWTDPVHQAFTPYKSPYEAYINYMNVLSDFRLLIS